MIRLAAALGAIASPALAEVSFGGMLASDFRYRGVSLSDHQPVASATASIDHASGFYASGSALVVNPSHGGVEYLGHQIYAGVAGRLKDGPSWDIGFADTRLDDENSGDGEYAYREVYAGLAWRNVSAHIYYSPNYLGEDARSLYASVDASYSPHPNWKLIAHAGLLTPFDRAPTSELRGDQFDFSAGVARKIGPAELQLRWTHHGPHGGYSPGASPSRDALVGSLGWSF